VEEDVELAVGLGGVVMAALCTHLFIQASCNIPKGRSCADVLTAFSHIFPDFLIS